MKKKTKNILLSSAPLIALSAVAIGVPVVQFSSVLKKPEASTPKYYLFDVPFNSRKEWEDQIVKLTNEQNIIESKKIYYSKNHNKSFNTLEDLKRYIAKNIVKKEGIFYDDIEYFKNNDNKNIDSSLSSHQLSKINLSNGDFETKVYMGKDGLAYESEIEAKNSYSNINLFYKFKDKYYDSKEKIIQEIAKKTLEIETLSQDENYRLDALIKYLNIEKPNNVFKAPNKKILHLKQPINNASVNEKQKLENFIRNNYKRYIKNKKNGDIFAEEDFIKNIMQKSEKLRMPIIKITSNKGRKKFLVDIHKDDPANLYGNYVHESAGNEILRFTDLSQWQKVDQIPSKDNMKHSSSARNIVNAFSSNLLRSTNSNVINDYFNKNSSLTEDEKKNIIKKYVDNFSILNYFKFRNESKHLQEELKKIKIEDNQTLLDKLEAIADFIKNGKYGDFFNNVSVSYISGLAYMAKYHASAKAVRLFKNYFIKIFNEINDSLKQVIGPDLYKNNSNQEIDLVKHYRALDTNFDFNVDLNFFIGILSNSRKVLNAMSIISLAMNNVASTNSLIKFNKDFIFDKNNIDDKEILEYQKLFNQYSLISKENSLFIYDDSTGEYIKNFNYSTNDEHKLSLMNTIAQGANSINQSTTSFVERLVKSLEKYIEKNDNKKIKEIFIENKTEWENIEKQNLSFSSKLTDKQLEKKFYKVTSDNEKNRAKSIVREYKSHKNKSQYKAKFSARQRIILKESKTIIISEKSIKSKAESIKNGIETAQKAISLFASSFSLLNNIINKGDLNYESKIAHSVRDVVNGILSFIPPNPVSLVVGAVLNIVMELAIQIIGVKEPKDYVFADTGNESDRYIWDGGISKSQFWGLKKSDVQSIEKDFKPLKPIEIIPEFASDLYYFDNKEYLSIDDKELNNDLLEVILSNVGDEYSEYKYQYSFENSANKLNENLYFDSVNDLVGDLVDNKNIKNYWTSGGYLYFDEESPTWVQNYSGLKDNSIDFIRNTLRPTLVMQIPKLDKNNIPIDQEYILKSDIGIDVFDEYKKIVEKLNSDNNIEEDLLIFDGNLQKTPEDFYYLTSSLDLEKKLEIFRNKFNVNWKNSSSEQFWKKIKFKNLKKPYKYDIYEITSNSGNVKSFISFDDAINFLRKDSFLDIYDENIETVVGKIYLFGDKKFNSIDEIISYCEDLSNKKIKLMERKTQHA
ncbi:hypothetical protein DA803_02695 [[Mycoplasma] phocae]|uniref:Uncharacterized protein n=1 Tax=[Mycoplasma] phocae TaxID=142651 RepID=A0A2Z5ISV9_9BACT|nr:hypothetical protein [[Mycoplasma] phocae]AXE60978.1 hypothetical protein DA803_02695 [[Mycoplasma] phocae]